jgi:hypothetical protein
MSLYFGIQRGALCDKCDDPSIPVSSIDSQPPVQKTRVPICKDGDCSGREWSIRPNTWSVLPVINTCAKLVASSSL